MRSPSGSAPAAPTLWLWDRDAPLLAEAAATLGGGVRTIAVDQTDAAAVAEAAAQVAAESGRIDILVANAGIAGANATLWEYDLDEWRRVIDVDLNGVFYCCRAIVPHMLAAGYGRIVNVASIAGKEGNPNASAYSAREGGGDRADQVARQGDGGQEHRRQLRDPGRRPHPDLRPDHPGAHRLHAGAHPARPLPRGRRGGGDDRLARLRGQFLHHRRGLRPLGRARDLLSGDEMALSDALTIADLKELARRRVPKMFFDYADSGAWTEGTYRANEADFAKIKLRQRVLVDMSDRSLATDDDRPAGGDAGGAGADRADRHAACRRRDAGGAGRRGLRRAVHAVDDEHLLDRGRRGGHDEAVLVPALRDARTRLRART